MKSSFPHKVYKFYRLILPNGGNILTKEEVEKLEKEVENENWEEIAGFAFKKRENGASVEEVTCTSNHINIHREKEECPEQVKIRGGSDGNRTIGVAAYYAALSCLCETSYEINLPNNPEAEKILNEVEGIVEDYKIQDEAGIPIPETVEAGLEIESTSPTTPRDETTDTEPPGGKLYLEKIKSDTVEFPIDSQEYSLISGLDKEAPGGEYEFKKILEDVEIDNGKMIRKERVEIEYK